MAPTKNKAQKPHKEARPGRVEQLRDGRQAPVDLEEIQAKAKYLGSVDVEHIAPGLRPLAVPVESLYFDPENARKHNRENLDAVKRSLEAFGQRQPLVVQKDGMYVRAGNARLQVARELGWKYVAALVVDDPDLDAKAYGIADNRTAELAEWDGPQLWQLLEELEDEAPQMLASVSFGDRELERLRARFGDQEAKGRPQEANPQEKPAQVGTKTLTLNYATPDHNLVKEALEVLKDAYGATTAEDTVLMALTELAGKVRDQHVDYMDGRKG